MKKKTVFFDTLVHSLLHLSDNVSNNGPLDSFFTFCFENLYGIINRKISCNGNQLTQLHNRLDEFYRSCSFNEHEIPLYHVDNNFTTKSLKHVLLLNYQTRVNDKDNYILLKDGVFCKVLSICTTQNVLIFKVHRYNIKERAFEITDIAFDKIFCKCFSLIIPYKRDRYFILLPLKC